MRVLRSLAAVTLAVIPVVAVPFALRAQMAAPQHSNRIALEQYLDWEVRPPTLARQTSDPLRAPVGRQDERPLGVVRLAHERRRHASTLPRQVRRSLCRTEANRYVARVTERTTDLRSLDGRRGAVTQISHLTEARESQWSPDGSDRVHDERAGETGASR
jgi:hypothetical protein